jgi:hypothetical protein
MTEEVKPKATAVKTKVVEKVNEVVEAPVVKTTPEPVVAEVKIKTESVVEAKPVVAPVVEESAEEPVEEITDEPVEAMSRRGRKAKSEKIAEFAHELSVKMHNEPHLESLYREEYAEKVAKLK